MRIRIAVLSLALVGACGEPAQKQAAEPGSTNAALAKHCDTAWSETEIAGRKATGLLREMDVDTSGLALVVDETRLADRPAGALDSLVAAADCVIAGPTGYMTSVTVRAASGRVIRAYSTPELRDIRKDG